MSSLLLSNLGVICPHCDQLNSPGSLKCAGCGKGVVDAAHGDSKPALGAAPVPRTAPFPSAAAPPASQAPMPTPAQRPSLAEAPPPGSRPDHSVPPGLRPTTRPPTAPTKAPPPVLKPQSTPMQAPPTGAPRAPAPAPNPPAPPPARPAPAAAAGPKYGLTIVAGAAAGQRFRLPATGCMIGRSKGAVLLPDDPHASPHHATLAVRDGRLVVKDESSTSGVYVTISGQETIPEGTCFCAGERVFRYAGAVVTPAAAQGMPVSYGAPMLSGQIHYRVEELLLGGRPCRALVLSGPLLTIGQGRCDLAYPADTTVAPRHCELAPTPAGALLKDLSGGLGTFVRLAPGAERVVRPGDRIRIGQHVLQVDVIPG